MIESANFTMIDSENYTIVFTRPFITSYQSYTSYIVCFYFLPEISLFSCIFTILSLYYYFTFINKK